MSATLDMAREYVGLGYPVLPVARNGKRPITAHGFRDATLDLASLQSWPVGCNVGVLPPVDVIVLDAETPEEVECLEREYPQARLEGGCIWRRAALCPGYTKGGSSSSTPGLPPTLNAVSW